MDFAFSQEQEILRDQLRKLLADVCPPDYAAACDAGAKPPAEAYRALGEKGWLGLMLPEDYGGAGAGAVDAAILLEEAGRAYEELAVWMFRTMIWGGHAIATHGTDAQKKEFLPRIAKGELSVCFGLTEPESGSDAAALKTRAVRQDDGGFLVNGQKVFTSGMDISDYCLLVARTSDTGKKQEGITTFFVDTALPGIEVTKIDTLGHRAIGTTQVFYSDLKLPAEAVVGEVDQGWATVDTYMWWERLMLSAARYGAAEAAFGYALDYAKEREQFGRPIGKFQAISHKLADMKTMLEVSRLLIYHYAWKIDRGEASRPDAAIVKLYTSEAYKVVSDLGLQIFGGYGYCMEYPMQRFFRDSRLAVIGAGSSEIQRNIIARGLGL